MVALSELRDQYLNLLVGALTHTLYQPIDTRPLPEEVQQAIREDLERTGERLELRTPWEERAEGRDRPVYGQTMIGLRRMENLRTCAETVLADGITGDFIEAGVWRGGAGLLLRGILEAYGDRNRRVWLADSFEGVPPPDADRYPLDAGDVNHMAEELAVSLEEVQGNFERYGLLDDQVRFVKGWFKDSLAGLADRKWALVRLDGDLYESTMDSLVNLYPQLQPGGFLIVDDYDFDNCRAAVEDYRHEHGISEPIERIDWLGAFWRRSA